MSHLKAVIDLHCVASLGNLFQLESVLGKKRVLICKSSTLWHGSLVPRPSRGGREEGLVHTV